MVMGFLQLESVSENKNYFVKRKCNSLRKVVKEYKIDNMFEEIIEEVPKFKIKSRYKGWISDITISIFIHRRVLLVSKGGDPEKRQR